MVECPLDAGDESLAKDLFGWSLYADWLEESGGPDLGEARRVVRVLGELEALAGRGERPATARLLLRRVSRPAPVWRPTARVRRGPWGGQSEWLPVDLAGMTPAERADVSPQRALWVRPDRAPRDYRLRIDDEEAHALSCDPCVLGGTPRPLVYLYFRRLDGDLAPLRERP